MNLIIPYHRWYDMMYGWYRPNWCQASSFYWMLSNYHHYTQWMKITGIPENEHKCMRNCNWLLSAARKQNCHKNSLSSRCIQHRRKYAHAMHNQHANQYVYEWRHALEFMSKWQTEQTQTQRERCNNRNCHTQKQTGGFSVSFCSSHMAYWQLTKYETEPNRTKPRAK